VQMRATSRTRRGGLTLLGLLLGVVLALAVVAPALTRESSERPKPEEDTGDVGREMALSAGCDMSQNEVPMNVGIYDYVREPGGSLGVATVEEAVLGMREALARDGSPFSREELEAAVAAADHDTNPIEVRLPGASISVERTPEGKYLVGGTVQCA
jgi:hypothetical protein